MMRFAKLSLYLVWLDYQRKDQGALEDGRVSYQILMDVSGDIDVSALPEAAIKFIPMEYSLGGDMRRCETMEKPEILKQFYDGQRNGDLTRTSQITPQQYEAAAEPYLEAGESVLYLGLSSGLSSTMESARQAQQNLHRKYSSQDFLPIDTLSATGGMGVLAERALRNQQMGMNLQQNVQDLIRASARIQHIFLVQDLMYLKRGGRISNTTAILGTALNINPILRIDPQGKLEIIDKKRGLKRSAKNLLNHFDDHYDPDSGDVIYIIDADAGELADLLDEKVRKRAPKAVIRHSGLSPIIGAHTGPGLAAICYMGK